MNSKATAEKIINNAIGEFNKMYPPGKKLNTSPDTLLYCHKGCLDSLGLINLIVAIENSALDAGVNFTLSSEVSNLDKNNIFLSVRALTDYIEGLIDKNG